MSKKQLTQCSRLSCGVLMIAMGVGHEKMWFTVIAIAFGLVQLLLFCSELPVKPQQAVKELKG